MFDDRGIEINEAVEARKVKIDREGAWEILSAAREIVAGRGRKIIRFDPSADDRDEILKVCTGRTGNLRAPTLRIGDLVLVGFNEEMFGQYLK